MIISEKNANKKLKNNILSLSQMAKKAKSLNNNVINATVGMFYDDENKLYSFDIVKEVVNNLAYESMFAYSDTVGPEKFKQAIIKWVFADKIDSFKDNYIEVVATPGGSGALSLTYTTYLKPGDSVILPNVMWETYMVYAKERDLGYLKYDLFNEKGEFSFDSLKEKIDELSHQENVVIIINDPCHNPTGFCMSDEEYDKLVDLLNSYNRNIVLIMDMAYFDYYSKDGSIIRSRYAKLSNLNENILTIFAFSGSKTFGLYGLRVGAAICASKDKKEVECFKTAFEFSARANWSSVSTLGMEIVSSIINDQDNYNRFKLELNNVSNLLEERSKVFIEESKRVGLKHLPFKCGFFVCIPSDHPNEVMNKLHEKDVYIVATRTCLRVAICGINKEECKRLPILIKEAIDAID